MRVRQLVAAFAAFLMVGITAAGASATEQQAPSSEYGVVDGRVFGPEDGYEVVTESYTVVPGGDPIEILFENAPPPGMITPFATWGTSYATSTETFQFIYNGKAKAAANVFNNQRIVKVCISFSHPGRTSPTVCSEASSASGRWVGGSEKTVRFVDNLSLNWPQTSFNIATTRINPSIL